MFFKKLLFLAIKHLNLIPENAGYFTKTLNGNQKLNKSNNLMEITIKINNNLHRD